MPQRVKVCVRVRPTKDTAEQNAQQFQIDSKEKVWSFVS